MSFQKRFCYCSIAVRRRQLTEKTFYWGLAYIFTELVHREPHGGVHGGRHSAGEVAEHSYLTHKLQGEADWVWQGLLKMQSPLRVTHFPQQGHAS